VTQPPNRLRPRRNSKRRSTNTGLIATSNVRGRAAAAHARSDPERTAGNVSA